MVDLHTHMLPRLDDGSQSMRESLMMARMAVDSGVSGIAVTPHCNIRGVYDNYDGEEFRKRVADFREEIKKEKLPLKVFVGAEVFAGENLAELIRTKTVVPLNDGRYLLIEFPFGEDGDWMTFLLNVVLENGYVPLVAHPERYDQVQADPNLAYTWVCMGCALQVNKGSIIGHFGRRVRQTAMLLLEHELAACVASDAHHAEFRTPHMTEVKEYLEQAFGKSCVQLLLKDNPMRILNSEEAVLLSPRGFRRKWFGLE